MAIQIFAKRAAFIFLVLGVISMTARAQSGRVQPTPTPTPDDETVKVETEEVKVNLIAFDQTGNFFPGVTEKDVVISENNFLHTPTSLRRMPQNVLIGMDTGGEMRSVKTLDNVRRAARVVLAALRPEDNVAILQYADKAVITSEWSTDRAQTNAAIGRTKFGLRSAFVDALNLARDFLKAEDLENKHIVLITDGTDSTADLSKKNAAMKKLLSTDITVHVISYTRMEAVDIEPRTKTLSKTPPPKAMPDEIAAGLPNGARDIATAPKIGPTINMDRTLLKKMRSRKDDLELSEEMLGDLVVYTNGTLIVLEMIDDIETKAATIAKMIDASYVLTYSPKVSFSERGGERKITVSSKRAGLIVQADRKFIVPAKKT